MKVLWVKSGGFVPADHGGRIRSLAIARELAKLHEVHLFTFYERQAIDAHRQLEKEFAGIHTVPFDIAGKRSARDLFLFARSVLQNKPYALLKYCRPEVKESLARLLATEHFDAIVCDFLISGGALPWDSKIPVVVFTHNVEAEIFARHIKNETRSIHRAVWNREFRVTDHLERDLLGRADHVLAVSDHDRDQFLKYLPPEKVSVIPTGADVDAELYNPELQKPNSLLFVGSMDWLPNEDAMLHFVKEIFPLVRKSIPEATLSIVGRKPSKTILSLAANEPGIEVTGRVDKVEPYLRDASVYVVPLRVGGGTRIKIFEAMAAGKTIVSTTIGAEGLDVTNGQNIVIADAAQDFANSVISLLRDSNARERIGFNAREHVQKFYSWKAVTKVLDDALNRSLNLRRDRKVPKVPVESS
jgi:polysaccharide biosynthesis protein PslH